MKIFGVCLVVLLCVAMAQSLLWDELCLKKNAIYCRDRNSGPSCGRSKRDGDCTKAANPCELAAYNCVNGNDLETAPNKQCKKLRVNERGPCEKK